MSSSSSLSLSDMVLCLADNFVFSFEIMSFKFGSEKNSIFFYDNDDDNNDEIDRTRNWCYKKNAEENLHL